MRDRHRPLVVAGCLLFAAWLVVWWIGATDGGQIGASEVLQRPPGDPVVLSLLRVLTIEGPERYVVGNAVLRIPIAGDSGARRVGEEITVGGVVEDDHVRATWVETAPGRPRKYALGLLGLALGAALWLGSVRVGREGLMLRG